jgi:hypothetical protein
MDGGNNMLVEISYPRGSTYCTFEPAFNVPYRLVQPVEVPATTLQEALDWTWRYANIVHQGDPWIKTCLRSAMVGDVFLVNGESLAVMMMGFQRFEFERKGYELIVRGQQSNPPINLTEEVRGTLEESDAERIKRKGKGHRYAPARATS